MGTKVDSLLAHKGTFVRTITPQARLADAIGLMDRHRIGALVVTEDGTHLAGIVSERDVLHHLADHGAGVLERSVGEVMTTDVTTCTRSTTVAELSATMTERRFRHVPVVEDGALIGLVSIGDVVRSQIEQLASERDELQAYVAGSY